MLHLFRSFLSSRLGAAFAMLVLILIALAFAAGSVGGMRSLVSGGGNQVATVGGETIDATALSETATNALQNIRQQNPQATMKGFLAAGGLDKVLDDLVDRTAVEVFGKAHGIIASDRLIDSEIAKLPAFRGLDGKFSETLFRQVLQQRGITEKAVREDIAQGLVARQILAPAAFGSTVPRELALRYAGLLKEKRDGAIALLPSPLFAPKRPPSDKELADYYATHRNHFIRPERRIVRYASFGDEALKNVPAPSDAAVAAYYTANQANYAASEKRRLTQLIVPTEAAAKAVADEVAKGKSLDAAAQEKGLAASKLGPIDKTNFANGSSLAVADAVFAAASGTIAPPAHSAIGWHVVHVDAIEKQPARSLDEARGEITALLTANARRAALADLASKIEDEFDKGGNLVDAAKELGVTVQQTPPLTSDGKSYEKPDMPMPPMLGKVVPTAFSMEREHQPQIAAVEPNKTFMIFDVDKITPSAPAPLAEIKQDVATALMLDKGSAAAKAAAEKLLAETHKGTPLAQAMAALKLALPPVQAVDMTRDQLTQQGRQPPPPLVLLFSMAEGTAKILPAAGNRGWFVVALKTIVPQQMAANDPLVPATQRELGQMVGEEYADSLRRAIRTEVTVKLNPSAVKTVAGQLGGGN